MFTNIFTIRNFIISRLIIIILLEKRIEIVIKIDIIKINIKKIINLKKKRIRINIKINNLEVIQA